MVINIYALTRGGAKLAIKIGNALGGHVYVKHMPLNCMVPKDVKIIEGSLKQLVSEHFKQSECMIFIMATGVVVRTIAPLIVSKMSDPAVLVLDEKAQFVISLLSGHIGGANRYAIQIGALTGANPVITTATDVNQTIAFDVFAQYNNCHIVDMTSLKFISGAIVNGDCVAFYCDDQLKGSLPQNIKMVKATHYLNDYPFGVYVGAKLWQPSNADGCYLKLISRSLVLGIGCKKGIKKAHIQESVEIFLRSLGYCIAALHHVATVDVKSEEAGILDFCQMYHLPLDIVKRSDILKIEHRFKGSTFVKSQIGISAVAEPCAVISGKDGELVAEKTAFNGITLALFKMKRVYEL